MVLKSPFKRKLVYSKKSFKQFHRRLRAAIGLRVVWHGALVNNVNAPKSYLARRGPDKLENSWLIVTSNHTSRMSHAKDTLG
jgi:hypothetical protein